MQLALSVPLAPAPGTFLALWSPSSSKPCSGGDGHTLQCCFLSRCWGHDVVLGVLKGSTSGGSCSWRSCCFVPCFHACSLSALNWWKEKHPVSLTSGRNIWSPTAHIQRERNVEQHLFPRQWWKHRINGLLCLAQNINIYWAIYLHFCWLVVACSVYCNMHSVVFITPGQCRTNYSDSPFLFKLLFDSVTYCLCLNFSSVCTHSEFALTQSL